MKRGFTLIELLITMTYITLISTIIVTVYIVGYSTFREELASSIVQSDAQTIMDSMTQDIKNGMLIEPAYSSYTTDQDTIIIRVPAIDKNNNIVYSGTDMLYDRIIYNYTNSSIHKIVFADPASSRYPRNGIDAVLDKNILSLAFQYNPNQTTATLVMVTISSEQSAGSIERKITLTGVARLRNHI